MRFALAHQGVLNAVGSLRGILQVDNVEMREADRLITWVGRSAGIVRGVYYPMEYQALLDRQQYSVLLADGSFFQFFYQFDERDRLKAARLAFYPRPMPTSDSMCDVLDAAESAMERNDEDLFEHLYNWTELLEASGRPLTNTSHIRFDYDSSAQGHAVSHLQLGAIQELRVPANFFPQPRAFVQLCQRLCAGLGTIETDVLRFEVNNVLRLPPPGDVIVLGTI